MKRIILIAALMSTLIGCSVKLEKADPLTPVVDSTSTVTLYSSNGDIISTWKMVGNIRWSGPMGNFTTDTGKKIYLSGTYSIVDD